MKDGLLEMKFLPPSAMQTSPDLSGLRFNADGLIPAIIQDAQGGPDADGKPAGRVLMMAWLNRTALESTLATGFMHYWSRSRQRQWFKGESSGHRQEVVDWFKDCDGDTLLFTVRQTGGRVPHRLRELLSSRSLERDGTPAAAIEEIAALRPAGGNLLGGRGQTLTPVDTT